MAGSASYQKAMGGISPARPTSPRQKARITTSELRRRGNSELASAQLPTYQSPTGWICDQTLSAARRDILTFAQNTRCQLCANSGRSFGESLNNQQNADDQSMLRRLFPVWPKSTAATFLADRGCVGSAARRQGTHWKAPPCHGAHPEQTSETRPRKKSPDDAGALSLLEIESWISASRPQEHPNRICN